MVTIDLLFALKFVFYLLWIAGVIILGYLLMSPVADNLYTLGFEMILRGAAIIITIIVLALSVLVYGGIYWW